MTDKYIYFSALIIFGIGLLTISYWIMTVSEENVKVREKIARDVIIGIILAIIDIAWCVHHYAPLASPWFKLYLIPTAVLVLFIGYFFLDYLFSRAFGGFLILLAYYFLHRSFTYHTPLASLFAIFCYAMGTAGLFFCGKPYLLRDFIRKVTKKSSFRNTVLVFNIVFGLFSIVLGLVHIMSK